MADGPRCQRRKQANPRRNNVRSFSNVSEAASDSDDEDKLHIVEEDSISDAPDEKPTVFQLSAAQQLHNGHTENDGNLGPDALIREIRVKEECVTDEENEEGREKETPPEGNEGAIYPEVPEEEQSTPERGGHDENGTPDEFSQLHTCPYCSRGYKRHTSLKEHIKLRHEKSEDDFSCSLCSYTFTYRTQLDRHMTAHKNGREQERSNAGGESVPTWDGLNDSDLSPSRKRRKMQGGQYACDLCDKIFQKSSSLLRHKYEHTGKRPHECGVCKKAFKHKHHLIEHTRLHSGEKPYQCDKCGKRFSHSGSYSQHMNHRYSYCKKEAHDQPEPTSTPSQLDSDERDSEAEEEEEDEEREGERDGNEDMEFAGFDMSEIRVVRVGEDCDEEEGEEEEGGGGEEEQVVEEEDAVELQGEEISTLEEEVVEPMDVGDSTEEKTEETGKRAEDAEVTDCVKSTGSTTEEGKNN